MSECLGREEFGNPLEIESTNAEFDMNPTTTVEVINTSLTVKQEEVLCRPTLALEYRLYESYLFTYTPYVPSGLPVSICPLSVSCGRRPFSSVIWGGVNTIYRLWGSQLFLSPNPGVELNIIKDNIINPTSGLYTVVTNYLVSLVL